MHPRRVAGGVCSRAIPLEHGDATDSQRDEALGSGADRNPAPPSPPLHLLPADVVELDDTVVDDRIPLGVEAGFIRKQQPATLESNGSPTLNRNRATGPGKESPTPPVSFAIASPSTKPKPLYGSVPEINGIRRHGQDRIRPRNGDPRARRNPAGWDTARRSRSAMSNSRAISCRGRADATRSSCRCARCPKVEPAGSRRLDVLGQDADLRHRRGCVDADHQRVRDDESIRIRHPHLQPPRVTDSRRHGDDRVEVVPDPLLSRRHACVIRANWQQLFYKKRHSKMTIPRFSQRISAGPDHC